MTPSQTGSGATSGIPILMYHSISDHSTEMFAPYVVHPDVFAAQLDVIQGLGYRTVTVSELVDELNRAPDGQPPAVDGNRDQPMVVITVDDGFADFIDQAMPRLLDRGQTATLYVPTGYVGRTSRWLTPEGEGGRAVLAWSQLRAVADAGVECGGHSHSHAQLDLLPASALDGEIRVCKERLEDNLGRAVRSFAYPFGYSNRRVRRLVADAGYDSACSVRDLQFRPADPRWSMARWTITADHDASRLEALLTHHRTLADQAHSAARAAASHLLRRARLRKAAAVTRGQLDLATTEPS